MIRSVTLDNIKSYEHATVEFRPGINAITGTNGAGKSTILEAIGYALFDHRPGKMADFVREGQKSGTVSVDFVSPLDDRPYRITRGCGSSSICRVTDPDLSAKICDGKADTMQFLAQHIGIDESDPSELFRNAVGVPQGSFTSVFLSTPNTRKSVFEPLLRVQEYRTSWERMREPVSLLKNLMDGQSNAISGIRGELTRLPVAIDQEARVLESMLDTRTELDQHRKRLDENRAAIADMDKQKQHVSQIQEQFAGLRHDLQRKAQEFKAAERAVNSSQESADIVEQNHTGHVAYREAQIRQAELSEQITEQQHVRAKLSTTQSDLARAEINLEHAQQRVDEMNEHEQLVIRLKEPVARLDALKQELHEAQERSYGIAATKMKVTHLREDVESSERRIAELEPRVERAQEARDALESYHQNSEDLRDQLDTSEIHLIAVRTRMESISNQRQTLQKVESERDIDDIEIDDDTLCPVCDQTLTPEHAQRLLAELDAKYADLSEQADAAKTKSEEIRGTLDLCKLNLKETQQSLHNAPTRDELEREKAKLEKLKPELEMVIKETSTLPDMMGRIDELEAEIKVLSEETYGYVNARESLVHRQDADEELRTTQYANNALKALVAELEDEIGGFAQLDTESQMVSDILREHREADDLYRRHQDAAAQLPQLQETLESIRVEGKALKADFQGKKRELEDAKQGFDQSDYDTLTRRVDQGRTEIARLDTKLEQWDREQKQLRTEISELKGREEQLRTEIVQLERLEDQSALLEFLRTVLADSSPHVINAVVQNVSHAASRMFEQIVGDHSRMLRWENDYGVSLVTGGHERAFTQLSGGEQMSAALAVRLALLQEMSDVSLAFFDEPTTNMDDDRRSALASQITEIQGFDQLFIISHDDSFETATENLIQIEKVNGLSEVVT